MTAGLPPVAPAYAVEPFRDYLSLEAGNSRHTVENYVRDVERFARYVLGQGIAGPGDVTAARLRYFVYAAPAT